MAQLFRGRRETNTLKCPNHISHLAYQERLWETATQDQLVWNAANGKTSISGNQFKRKPEILK